MMKKIEIIIRHKLRSSRLLDFYWHLRLRRLERRGSFAQHGEDRIMLDLHGSNGTYLDIGANHPFLISNTYLLYRHGWRGVTVEPIRALARMHKLWRPKDIALNVAVGEDDTLSFYEIYPDVLSTTSQENALETEQQGAGVIIDRYNVLVRRGDSIAREYFPDGKVTLMSIDVEGAELSILRSFDFSFFRPEYIIIEHHGFIEGSRQDQDISILLRECNYRKLKTIGSNTLFQDILI